MLSSGCDSPSSPTEDASEDDGQFARELECSIPQVDIVDGGVGFDGIPSLENPDFVTPDEEGAAYLEAEVMGIERPRVVGLVVDGKAWAIPHHILWYHEIVNLDFSDDLQVAVTYCPLTGSSLAFDRGVLEGATLGVSGLLFRNNLIMFDRTGQRSLWPQMMRQARCGPRDGTELPMVPVVEMTWEGWKRLHPDTRVVSMDTEEPRDYTTYPYGNYEHKEELLFPQGDLDRRRPLKERVLGILAESGEIAFPFGEMAEAADGDRLVIRQVTDRGDLVVLWDGSVHGAMAFRPMVDGESVTLQVEGDHFVDEQTGSVWTVEGRAVEGPMANEGATLEPVAEAHVAFWFAWAAFNPATELWQR